MVQPVLPHPVCVVMGLSLLPAQAVFSSSGAGALGKSCCRNVWRGKNRRAGGVRLGGPDVLKGDPGSWLLKSWHLSLELGAWSRLSLDRGMRQRRGWRQFQKLEETGTWKERCQERTKCPLPGDSRLPQGRSRWSSTREGSFGPT